MEKLKVELGWRKIVKEATLRRKSLGMTQRRLAALAGVSTPVVSKFENYSDKVLLCSAIAILKQLGMVDNGG